MKLNCLLLSAIAIILSAVSFNAAAQSVNYRFENGRWVARERMAATHQADEADQSPADTLAIDSSIDVSQVTLGNFIFLPSVFDRYDLRRAESPSLADPAVTDSWIDNAVNSLNRRNRFIQAYQIANPADVRYNILTLPEAPKQYIAFVDPSTASITVKEVDLTAADAQSEVEPVEVKRKNWLTCFSGLVQFSQAYNSPNWYQGGNNNLNLIINGVYKINLNPAYHPKLLFENTIAYKLAMNSAPDDSLRNYSISEDLLQINSKFGVKASKKWYYSMTLQFKTQLFNNYKTNTHTMTAAFLSPAELTLGLGMTYATKTARASFDASIAPLSYNLKTCTNRRVDPTSFGIEAGHRSVHQFGSNIDCKLVWNIAYNIIFTSRLTAFTDYSYIQGDWENTLAFNINRFLSTQLYVHLRYDSQGSAVDDSKWKKWQLKEILSFGFSYSFGV